MTFKLFIPKLIIMYSMIIPALGLEIDNFTKLQHERFTNDASFVGVGLDLSGFGRDQSGKWATLISPNVFISADHYQPSGTINFYKDNDINGAPVQRNVIAGQKIANSDLFVGCLDSPVTPDITYYNFANSIAGLGSDTIAYQPGIPDVDRAISSGYPNTLNMVLGMNKLTSYRNTTQFGNTSETLWTTRDIPTDPNYLSYESIVQSGDSGSALFTIDGANEITLLGTAWYKGSFFSVTGSKDASVYTFTGEHAQDLNNYVAQHAPVPEPSSTLLSALSLFLFSIRRRRKYE